MKIVLDKGAIKPTRAYELDAGLDLYSKEEKTIHGESFAVFDTGVHIQLEPGTAGFIKSRAGLNAIFGIQSEGVIDAGFTGSIKVKLYNHNQRSYKVKVGDRIAQLVIVKIETPELEVVEELDSFPRGEAGLGSSGK